jgi:hypothetical protein
MFTIVFYRTVVYRIMCASYTTASAAAAAAVPVIIRPFLQVVTQEMVLVRHWLVGNDFERGHIHHTQTVAGWKRSTIHAIKPCIAL